MTVALATLISALNAAGVSAKGVAGLPDLMVQGVSSDSRTVQPGDLFLAWAGDSFDAHDVLADVAVAGAVAALVERPVDVALPQVLVENGRRAAALVADHVAGSPWKNLCMVGVTGTNGKTTTSLLLRTIFGADSATAAIGTLGVLDTDGRVLPGTEGLTTPGPVDLAAWVSSLASGGARTLVLEASSHALDQYRLDGLRFDVAVYTNLTRDHLDYHGDFASYLAAKGRLLELVKTGGRVVVNDDDPAWKDLKLPATALTYGIGENSCAELRALDLVLDSCGSSFVVEYGATRAEVVLPLAGRFNVENALAATGAALAVGLKLEAVAKRLGTVPQVPGRMERIHHDDFTVLIDFAHTPDALSRMLKALRPTVTGRLIVVFGAGGDRDAVKRPEMGRAVAAFADIAVVTSDNPRTEDPAAIVDQVAAGVEGCETVSIIDRGEAILWALHAAGSGDCVVLAGKGHETYQVVGTEKLSFNETALVSAFFATRSTERQGGA